MAGLPGLRKPSKTGSGAASDVDADHVSMGKPAGIEVNTALQQHIPGTLCCLQGSA